MEPQDEPKPPPTASSQAVREPKTKDPQGCILIPDPETREIILSSKATERWHDLFSLADQRVFTGTQCGVQRKW